MPAKNLISFSLPFLLFAGIYFSVFSADYAYLDEIHQLWHNGDGNNFTMFHTQGRWLSGIFFNKIFAAIDTIEGIKYIRIVGFCGGLLFLLIWQIVFLKWSRMLKIDTSMQQLGGIFVVCGASTAIYIGWASCAEIFYGLCAGLLSGHIFFTQLYKKEQKEKLNFFFILLSLLLGIISLFIYQNTFGIFLFPFFIWYLSGQAIKPARPIIYAIAFYLLVYVVYYFLFRYSLTWYTIAENERVGISTDWLKKLSFLFSDPLPSAFSFNILYTARSIFSQIWAPAMMIAWAVSVFIRYKNRKAFLNIIYLLIVPGFLILMYIPSMIAKENFASYRTLFVFNLAVSYLLSDAILYFCRNGNAKKYATIIVALFFIITGYYNYNFQLVNPLKAEYKVYHEFMQQHAGENINTIHFIRADRFLFTPFFHTNPYKDEFGAPSASRDWVPEPITWQTMYEMTGERELAAKIKVVQYADSSEFNAANISLSKNELLIDMNKLFNEAQRTQRIK